MALQYHPEFLAYMKWRGENAAAPYSEYTVADARKISLNVSLALQGHVDFTGDVWDVFVPSPHWKDGIPVTVYKPQGVSSTPSIFVYIHGGGLVVGDRRNTVSVCKAISSGAGCIVLNMEYRKAPEHKFPAAMDDGNSVLTWVLKHKEEIGGCSSSTVGVGGDSCGGKISASLCHEIPGINYQVLIYGSVDQRTDRPSHKIYKDGHVLTLNAINWFWSLAFRDELHRRDIRACPIDRENFSQLPPVLFIVAEHDPIRDDSYDYERKLREAGVKTKLVLIKGVAHTFFHLPGMLPESCAEAYRHVIEFIKANK